MSIISGIRRRIASARATTKLSTRWRDWPALAVFGLARYTDFGRGDPLSRVCRRLFPVLSVRPDRTGNVAVVMNPADPSHFVIFDEVVVENVYDLDLVPFVPARVVDCGGHIGLFTARAAGRYPGVKITTFEPMPKNAAMIDRMVAVNGIDADVRHAAVSDRDYSTQFYERMSYGGSLTSDVQGVHDAYDVTVIDLVQFVKQLGPGPLLLKMDIEGEEENLLPKLIPVLPARCALFFETHTADKGWDPIAAALEAAGFKVTLIRARDPFRDGLAVRDTPASPVAHPTSAASSAG